MLSSQLGVRVGTVRFVCSRAADDEQRRVPCDKTDTLHVDAGRCLRSCCSQRALRFRLTCHDVKASDRYCLIAMTANAVHVTVLPFAS